MAESIAIRLNATSLDNATKRELINLLLQMQTDIAAIKTAFTGVTTKLDTAGASVTNLGTNYTSTWPLVVGTTK